VVILHLGSYFLQEFLRFNLMHESDKNRNDSLNSNERDYQIISMGRQIDKDSGLRRLEDRQLYIRTNGETD
jgi:hypothetical protein